MLFMSRSSRARSRYACASRVPSATEPALLGEYREWMLKHRGVRDSTLSGHARVIGDLLESLGEETQDYAAGALRAFVLEHAGHRGIATAKATVTAVRMFLRFLGCSAPC